MSMLNWICPECGREVPAADPDCPACTGAIHEQLPLPLVLDPPAADPAGAPLALAAPPREPEHSLPVAAPQPAELASEAPLVPIARTGSEATGTERHSLAAPLSESDPPAPVADAHGSAAAPLSPASLEEPRAVSDAQPAEPANDPSL